MDENIGNTAQLTAKALARILLASFPSFCTKILQPYASMLLNFSTSDEKSDCAIHAL